MKILRKRLVILLLIGAVAFVSTLVYKVSSLSHISMVVLSVYIWLLFSNALIKNEKIFKKYYKLKKLIVITVLILLFSITFLSVVAVN
jgi:hypoxanthine-guanine phosphoribosyltransferase